MDRKALTSFFWCRGSQNW